MKKKRELVSALVALLVGLPMVYLFGRSMAEAEVRRRESPLQAVLGEPTYRALRDGEKSPVHYLGRDRLAPDFELRDREGRPFRLADQRGKLVVMNFWTITCQPCVEEIPSLEELAKLASDWPDVEVIAVTTDQSWAEVASVLPPNPALKVLFDPEKGVVRDKFGTRLFPETWIIDARGVVRFRYDGPLDWSSPLVVDLIRSFL